MITLNAAHLSASKPSSSVARIKWPVDETGRNSVTPSTMPRMIAISRMGMPKSGPGLRDGGQMNSPAGELAARAKAVQPFVGDRGKRRRLDPERLQPQRALRRDIVALEHKPLVAGQRRAGQPAETRQQACEGIGHCGDLRVLPGSRRDRLIELGHGQHLRTSDLVTLAGMGLRLDR